MTATIIPFPTKNARDRQPPEAVSQGSNGFNGRSPREEMIYQMARELLMEKGFLDRFKGSKS